jgi:hypothetical protein
LKFTGIVNGGAIVFQELAMIWAVIRCNLRDPARADKFNHWYNGQHAPRYIRQPGFRRGWRLEKLDHPAQRGDPGQRYLAIYETESAAAFNAALDRDLVESHPWEEWENRIKDWQRTYYRDLLSFGQVSPPEQGRGGFWTMVRVDLDEADPAQEQAFNDWYDTRHVPEVCAFPGFRRAWRLRLEPDPNDLGPRGQKYLAVYETDIADYLPTARRGATPWDGIWADRIRNWEIGFYRKLYDYEGLEKA